jgi:DNA-binding PadR family transcriptional regulator
VIRSLNERFEGRYTPSAGSVYPRLRQLQLEGLVDASEREGRVVYRLTPAGKEALGQRAEELQAMDLEIGRLVQEMAAELKSDVRTSARALREELQAEARALSTSSPPFRHELDRELARFTAEWARLVPSGTSTTRAQSALHRALEIALEELRRAFRGAAGED